MSRLIRALRPRRRLVHVTRYGDLANPWDAPIWEPDPRGEFR
jgi:hypothetical protein